MTIEIVPVAASPWRDAYRVPKDLQLEYGPWCSMDQRAGLLPEHHGWACPTCGAWWDQHGRNGRWLAASTVLLVDGHLIEPDEQATGEAWRLCRVDRVVAATIAAGVVMGGGFAAGRAMRPHADAVPETLLWTLTLIIVGLLLIGAGALLAWQWWTGRNGGGAR